MDRRGRRGTQSSIFDPRPGRTGFSSAKRMAVGALSLRKHTDSARACFPGGTGSQLDLDFSLSLSCHIFFFFHGFVVQGMGVQACGRRKVEGTKGSLSVSV